jgi:hypothetical protein
MATVTTTTATDPLIYPSQSQIERVRSGDLWVMVKATTANTFELWRSQNAGGSWALAVSVVRANVQEVGVIQAMRGPYNQLFWLYRTYETGADRVWLRSISDLGAASLAWNPEVAVASAFAGSAGAVLSGLDMQNVVANGQILVAAGIGVQSGANRGAHFNVLSGSTAAGLSQNNNLFTGTRLWVPEVGTGRVTPSVDIEHTGDGHSGSTPHLWMSWGRTQAYTVKCSWTGSGWSGPTAPVKLNPITLTPAQDSIAARWDGQRFITVVPDPSSTSVVTLFERNRSNSTTTIRQTPTHPQGVVKNCSLGYNSITGDIRVYAVGTTTAVLYYVDYVRATGTWTSWATVTATAIAGTNVNNYSIRRATDGRYEVLTLTAANAIVHTAQSLSYTPNVPVWDPSTMQLQTGAAYDVNTPLTLDWVFSDPDPADTQSAYAVSRQIGAGALNYWRASDSTWQVAEVQNTSGTSAITVPAPWGSGTDAATTFKAKVWDSASIPSAYGDGFTVTPSTAVNPAITAPTVGQVLTSDTVTLTWTAAEQSAWRARMWALGAADTYTGRTNSGSFGTAEFGGAWATSGGAGSDYNVASGAATMSVSTINVFRTALVETLSTNHTVWADVSVNVASPTGAPVSKWVIGRALDTSNHYIAQMVINTNGTVTLTLQKRVAGSLSGVGVSAKTIGTAHASGEVWRIVLDVQDDTLRCKAWRVSGTVMAEPEWLHVVTGETSLTTGTKAGVLARVETSNTNTLPLVFTVDNFFAGNALAYDTGWSNTGVSSYLVPVRMPDLSAWLFGLRTRNVEALAGTEQLVHVTVDYVEPEAATTVATPDPTNGVINVAITNPTPVGAQPAVVSQDLYVRPNVAGANTLANGGFEVNTTGWGLVTAASFVRSTAQFHSGVASGLLTPDGVSALPRAESSVSASPVTVPGALWTFDGWLRATTANKPIRIVLNWYDSGGSFISQDISQVVTPIAGVWQYMSVTAMAPALTNKVGGGVALSSTPAAGDTLFIDDMRLRPYDATAGTLIGSSVASGATVADYRAASGVDYEYRVLTRGANGTSITGPWTA